MIIECRIGRGKGIAIFSLKSRKFFVFKTVIKEKYQMITIVDQTIPEFSYQLILMYLSSNCAMSEVVQDLILMFIKGMKAIIIGDFNFNYGEENDLSNHFLNEIGMEQKVTWPTHCQGRTLDHCYTNFMVDLTRHSPYYSDHSALCIEFQHREN